MGANTDDQPLSFGLWLIIGFHALNLVLWFVGQTGAYLWFDFAVSVGAVALKEENEPAIIQTNIGMGLADTFITLPLFGLALVGLLRRKFYGVICSWMAFGLTLYCPWVYWMCSLMYRQGDIVHTPVSVTNIVVLGVFWLFAVWGSWYLCRREKRVLSWWQSELEPDYQPVV